MPAQQTRGTQAIAAPLTGAVPINPPQNRPQPSGGMSRQDNNQRNPIDDINWTLLSCEEIDFPIDRRNENAPAAEGVILHLTSGRGVNFVHIPGKSRLDLGMDIIVNAIVDTVVGDLRDDKLAATAVTEAVVMELQARLLSRIAVYQFGDTAEHALRTEVRGEREERPQTGSTSTSSEQGGGTTDGSGTTATEARPTETETKEEDTPNGDDLTPPIDNSDEDEDQDQHLRQRDRRDNGGRRHRERQRS